MKKSILSIFFVVFCTVYAAEDFYTGPVKKFIKTGWDDPTPEYLAKNLAIIENALPHSGIAIQLDIILDDSGKVILPNYTMFSSRKWKKEWFASQIKALKTIKTTRLTDNFLTTCFLPGDRDFDLYNDQFWSGVCHNFKIIAEITRECGLKGIILDIEDYWKTKCWQYRPEKGHTFQQDYNKARQRGREFMRALGNSNPEINILAYFWLELERAAFDGTPELLEERLKVSDTGLLSGFINGIYDVLPAKTKIHDGLEDYCYKINNGITSYNRFLSIRKNRFLRLIRPENHAKLRAQTFFAPGIYVDSYINEMGNYRLSSKELSPLELFRFNALLATEYSDEYIWTFSECRKWYPAYYKPWMQKSLQRNPKAKGEFWKTALPGIEDAIRFAATPYSYSRENILNGKFVNKNIAVNGTFESTGYPISHTKDSPDIKPLSIPGWSCWHAEKSTGNFEFAPRQGIAKSNAILAKGVSNGVILQNHKLKKGKSYFIRASVKTKGEPFLCIHWKDADSKWCSLFENTRVKFSESLPNGWRRASQFFTLPPEEAAYFSVLISVHASTPDEECLIDNVEIYEL